MSIIHVSEVSKSFRRKRSKPGMWGAISTLIAPEHELAVAVEHVSFSIERGESVGYIGRNGAGKSTTIKMLSGILVPTSGRLRVCGLSPTDDRVAHTRNIGVVFGQRTQLWWDVPVLDGLQLLRDVYGVSERRFRQNLELFDELLELHRFRHVPVRQLSLGQRVCADIAAALLHDPEILFLDEPTVGVDVVSKERLREFIRTINRERRTTLLLTTHDMAEVERICSRALVIDEGRILHDGSIASVRALGRGLTTLEVETEGPLRLPSLSSAQVTRISERRAAIVFDASERPAAAVIAEIAATHEIRDISVVKQDLESVVRQIYADRRTPRPWVHSPSGAG